MGYKSNLGQNGGGAPSGGAPSGGAPAAGAPAAPANQGGFGPVPFPGQFPVGVPVYNNGCPSGWLPAPSAIVPGGYTCVRAPGAYTTPLYMAGRRR